MRNLLSIISTFRKKFAAHQKFSDGSEIRSINRMTLRYIEGEKWIDIGFHIYEGIIGSKATVSFWYVDSWHYPKGEPPLSDSTKDRIVKKIEEYCEARAIECRIFYCEEDSKVPL